MDNMGIRTMKRRWYGWMDDMGIRMMKRWSVRVGELGMDYGEPRIGNEGVN